MILHPLMPALSFKHMEINSTQVKKPKPVYNCSDKNVRFFNTDDANELSSSCACRCSLGAPQGPWAGVSRPGSQQVPAQRCPDLSRLGGWAAAACPWRTRAQVRAEGSGTVGWLRPWGPGLAGAVLNLWGCLTAATAPDGKVVRPGVQLCVEQNILEWCVESQSFYLPLPLPPPF